MTLALNTHLNSQLIQVGNEQQPVLVIDNFVEHAHWLRQYAAELTFEKSSAFYPGVRALAPVQYAALMLNQLQDLLIDAFKLPCQRLSFSVCHYSLVTQPENQLHLLQRIPHFDSLDNLGLACVHYLFDEDSYGGTAFYRHNKTGYESITSERKAAYFQSLESENGGPNMPKLADGYINGNTALYTQTYAQPAAFNRLVVYRRNILHSGMINKGFVPETNPLRGRLSINSFIDCRAE